MRPLKGSWSGLRTQRWPSWGMAASAARGTRPASTSEPPASGWSGRSWTLSPRGDFSACGFDDFRQLGPTARYFSLVAGAEPQQPHHGREGDQLPDQGLRTGRRRHYGWGQRSASGGQCPGSFPAAGTRPGWDLPRTARRTSWPESSTPCCWAGICGCRSPILESRYRERALVRHEPRAELGYWLVPVGFALGSTLSCPRPRGYRSERYLVDRPLTN